MRSDAKTATAGSDRQQAAKKVVLPVSLFVALLALLVVVGSASATKTHLFKEAFGPSEQPTFTSPRGMAIDQGSGEVYVIDAGSPPSVKRYNANGSVANFSALSSNVIDGAGGADTTPQGSLAFGAANRVQIAIDESGAATDGDIYVAQQASKLIDVFSSTGEYKGQLTESSEGLLGEICGVAVDSAGKLYLGDIAGKVHVYTPAANPPVNGDSSANFATVAAPCQIAAGTGATAGFIFVNRSNGELKKVDSATGEVKYQVGGTAHRTVYVNPGTGHVYAPRSTGSSSEVVEYDASGAASATTVSSFKPGSTIEGVAVRESNANVYLTRSGQAEAQVYGPTVTQPDVTTTAVSGNTGTHATLNGTVNPDGVELSECKFEWSLNSGSFENTAPCAESNATIGAGTSPVAVHADVSGLAPQGTGYKYRLVAKNPESPAVTSSQQSFTTPATVVTTAASGLAPTEATLNGTVNPDGVALTECVFEYGPPKGYGESVQQYTDSVPCVPGPGGIGAGTSPVAVSAALSGLDVGSVYHYRLKAASATGPIVGGDMSFQTLGPVLEGAWAENVIRTEATLKAAINPRGSATTYRFEWGPTAAYGNTSEGGVGSDSSSHEVSVLLEGLEPATTYHYHVVATNGVATSESPDLTFTTYRPFVANSDCPNQANRYGPSGALPDCRAYEMVSPVDKSGGSIASRVDFVLYRTENFQAALDGDKLAYTSYRAFGDARGNYWTNQYIASRGADGWSSHGISPPHENHAIFGLFPIFTPPLFGAFTDDLSTGFLMDDAEPPLTSDALPGEINAYLYHTASDTYTALSTEKFANFSVLSGTMVQGYSKDGSHVLFGYKDSLTPDASPSPSGGAGWQIYDYTGGQLHLVSVLPGGEAARNATVGAPNGTSVKGAVGTNRDWEDLGAVDHAVSDDGSRVFWTNTPEAGGGAKGRIYVRIDGTTTIPVSESVTPGFDATFRAASTDGSRAIFSVGPPYESVDLYSFDVDAETPSLIAGRVNGFLGAADDLSRIYFISEEDLAPGAVDGKVNLYVDHEGAISFIARLSMADVGGLPEGAQPYQIGTDIVVAQRYSRVTPDGRHLAFQSLANPTGYDNTSLESGKPATEVYLYDAATEELTCASCNPSGGRPQTERLSAPHVGVEGESFYYGPAEESTVWSAAWLPTSRHSTHLTRILSDDGKRLFFHSFDALVPQDTNGAQDVYEWEAQGKGDCEKPGGCISLISTGESPEESEFIDASEDGRDVFIKTASSIAPQDTELIDLYDARVGGGYPPPPPAPTPCVGDACQSAPEPPHDPTPASAAFRGAGNPAPGAAGSCARSARKAQKLSRRAKRLRRHGESARRNGKSAIARKRNKKATRLAQRAKGKSKRAKRCRRAERRASR